MSRSLKLKAWISAARLRTLPLSISGILTGSACAYFMGSQSAVYGLTDTTGFESQFSSHVVTVTLLGLLTTLGFQVLSNFANDYGDGVKGTDNDQRIGPKRAIQSGTITPQQMKTAVIITAIFSFISAVTLIIKSLGFEKLLVALFFLALGIAAIWAAIKYTVGKDAYGYSGLGDIFVFIFFGPVSVMGIYYLILQELNPFLILPSLTIGLLSVAVLNLNNMRDINNDRDSGKNTIVVKMGILKAKVFHLIVLSLSLITALLYLVHLYSIELKSILFFIPLLAFLPIIRHSIKVIRTNIPSMFDPELKKVALSTFLFSLLIVTVLIYITVRYK